MPRVLLITSSIILNPDLVIGLVVIFIISAKVLFILKPDIRCHGHQGLRLQGTERVGS